ncbi:FAD-binding oxidoreductase [Alphaproteobacteria bacterium]|nr:FAD-binding oxidoreductase [Alphaproteobacteria bacterium]
MIIVGGGIVGASFAYHAHLMGVSEITQITGSLLTNKEQATSNTWGWVNGYASNDKKYAAFRLANLKYWSKLINDIKHLTNSSKGAFFWDMDKSDLSEAIAQHQSWGHSVSDVIKLRLEEYLPNLHNRPEIAGFGENDLAIEGSKAADILIKASGSQIKKSNVNKLIFTGNKVIGVETDEGIIYSDEVIIAAGLGTPDLLSTININFKMSSTLGLLAYTNPLPKLILQYPITGKDFHARQDNQGRLVIGGKFDDDASKESNIKVAAKKLVQDMDARLNYNGFMTLEHYTLGRRPLPIDGRPKIGRLKNHLDQKIKGIYLAVMHSGITNAPLAGKLGIEEVITGKRHSLITDFFPQTLTDNESKSNV